VLAKLEAFVGADRALQREIARQFYDLAPDRIVQVEDALRRRDYPRLREWCHALTGTSAMIGAEVLQQHIAHLQDHIAYGSSGAIEAAVEAVVDELRQIAIVLDHDYHLSSANA
jgi:HPt (histidine-containing phosphotransfer) domain-containing protein